MSEDHSISRRQFLKNGALLSGAVLTGGAAAAPWIRPPEVEASLMGIGQELREILNGETVNRILIEALLRGGDYADVFAEQRFRTNIVLDDGKVDSVTYGYPRGAGVRVYYRRQTGYAFSDEIQYEGLLDAARVASSVVVNQGTARPIDVTPRTMPPPFTVSAPVALMPEPTKFEMVRRMDAAARAVDKRIVSVRIEYVDDVRDVLVGTSDGVYAMDRQYLLGISCVATAVDGTNRRTGLSSLGGRVGTDYFQRRDPETVAREAARQAVTLLTAVPAPAGPMPVVIAPGWGGVLIHESFGHALEGDGIRRGTSLLTGKLGQRIGAPALRVVDDARWQYGRGSYAVDDEGVAGQRTVLVDGGILQSYVLDRQSAAYLNLKPTGNGRRQTYRNWPLPRMSNTYIDRGTDDPAALLTGITKGFYAADLGGGSVDTTSGNFNFAVRMGYLIENGKLTSPVRGAVLIGNSLQTMERIEGVGSDLAVEQSRGTCGKDGQMVPVGVGQPTVRFSSITVGGTAI
jgi:TldD protein